LPLSDLQTVSVLFLNMSGVKVSFLLQCVSSAIQQTTRSGRERSSFGDIVLGSFGDRSIVFLGTGLDSIV
jgi:hypothetical protein